MNIAIQKLTLSNFKCFRSKEIVFEPCVTTIRGRNGVGKTTIADAILWCLFGKNSQGQSDFDLKTHDDDGKPIPNLEHSVEMVLMITDGTSFTGPGSANLVIKPVTLKRTLKETWIKKRASNEQVFKNNTTEYLVNGDSFTAADYKKYIAQLIDEDIFRAITNPTYFPSLKWQVQREFLTKMIGDIEPEVIANTDELVDLVHQLDNSNDDIISYRKHLSYQIKQIKEKLDKIPVRLEEQNKALPESLDWSAIEQQCADALRQQKEIDEKIIAIRSGNGGDVLRNEIRTSLKSLQGNIDKIEETERKAYNLRRQEHDNMIAEAGRKFNQLVTNQRDLETSIPSFDRMLERCKETLAQCEKDAQTIREEWANNLSRTLHFGENESVCPTCGQYLPDEIVAEKRKKAEEDLNSDKARIKTELTERANKVKKLRADAEEEIKSIEQKKADAEKTLNEIKEDINKAFSEKANLEKTPVLSFEQALSNDESYQALLQDMDELKKKLDSVGIDDNSSQQLTELEAKKGQYEAEIGNYQHQLATRDMRLKILALIDGINEEQKDLVRQLSELEKKEDVARSYQDRQNTILEERINQHFSLVKWKLFRTVNNGGDPFDEPFCECYVNGVAYHDGLNQAARLNAGLDIINTLCKHYNVSAPIVLDNSESTINILDTIGQQVRLQVADTDFQLV